MKTEIICALIALVGTLISAVIAWFVSRSTANKEIEQLKLTWEREDVVSSDDEFAKMASNVASYIQCDSGHYQREAMSSAAAIRAKESGELGMLLDQLYSAIEKDSVSETNQALTRVIEKKREAKSKTKTPE